MAFDTLNDCILMLQRLSDDAMTVVEWIQEALDDGSITFAESLALNQRLYAQAQKVYEMSLRRTP